ncbi:MAG: fused response regulator/phosphatase [Enterobacterales bacterium]|nr:fused response regulator/phosphatase [Enterobacterales bacterium]
MKILIADDNSTDRMILTKILQNQNAEVLAAKDGLEAVEFFQEFKPDLILMDALMPNMDGYEAVIEIKKLAGETLVPIIFLTSLKEASELARCLEVGGDDFLTKPYNKTILEAKIKALERMKSLHDEVRTQRNEIQKFNEHMIREQEVGKKLFDKIAHNDNLNTENIRYLLSPMSIFNGDLLLVDTTPSGIVHILIGDFTGHGLPAAIGTLPVADIFYGMTAKGFSVIDIITEINTRLCSILPVGVFCCATICEVNYRDNSLMNWSGGLPDGYLVRPEHGIVERFISRHLPLGVLSPENFSQEVEVRRFETHDRIMLFSDGILEAESPKHDFFSTQQLEKVIAENVNSLDTLYDKLLLALNMFTQSEEQSDDYTLIEYGLQQEESHSETSVSHIAPQEVEPMEWCTTHEFRATSLKTFDPLPLILRILNDCAGLNDYRSQIFTILAELYTNALDHGVLGMNSSLKESVEGFTEYYAIKAHRLKTLEDGFVNIRLENIPSANGGTVHIRVSNSGAGFDYENLNVGDKNFSGRGLKLVRSLSQSVEFSNNGKQIDVRFDWEYS